MIELSDYQNYSSFIKATYVPQMLQQYFEYNIIPMNIKKLYYYT